MIEKPNRALIASILSRVWPSQTAAAEALSAAAGVSCSQQTIQAWLKREKVSVEPTNWVLHIAKASKGKIQPSELRPDIYETGTE